MVKRDEQYRALLRAICQQWLNDQRPKKGKEVVEAIARHLMSTASKQVWYNQARKVCE